MDKKTSLGGPAAHKPHDIVTPAARGLGEAFFNTEDVHAREKILDLLKSMETGGNVKDMRCAILVRLHLGIVTSRVYTLEEVAEIMTTGVPRSSADKGALEKVFNDPGHEALYSLTHKTDKTQLSPMSTDAIAVRLKVNSKLPVAAIRVFKRRLLER